MKKTFAVFLLLFFACRLTAQTTASVTMLTVNDGLSQGMIFDIIQSRDGFIWIATKDGLNRYDGSRFKIFSPDPFDPFAIANSEVRSIFEDSRGWIWVAFQAELDIFDPSSGRFYHVLHDGGKNFNGNGPWMMTIEESPDEDIWVANQGALWKIKVPNDLLALAAQKGISTIYPSCKMTPKPTGGPCIFKNNNLLTATEEGLFRLDPATGEISLELLTSGWKIGGLSVDIQGNIVGRADNTGTGKSQLILINRSGIQPLPIQSLENFALGQDESLWVVLNDGHIQKWKRSSMLNGGTPELEIRADSVIGKPGGIATTKFLLDKSGVAWLGTKGYGLLKINQKVTNFKNYDRDARRYLEGPDGGIYSLYSPNAKYPTKKIQSAISHTDFWVPLDKFEDNSGFSACFDAAENGWSSDRRSKILYRKDAQTKSLKSFPWDAGSGLILSRSGALLGASEKGLMKFDPKTETSTEFPFDQPQKIATLFSYFLYEDKDGAVWIFGLEGLTKAVPTTAGYQFDYFRNNPADRSSLSINIVLSVADDPLEPQRYLWVGTKGGGLNRLDKKTNQFKHYKTAEGLPDNVVYGILAEDAKPFIWLSTNQGLCRFHVREGTTKNFTAADGLQDNEFNSSSYLKTRDGSMIFGGVKGLTVFHPDSLRFNENVPQIRIVGLQVNNQKFDIAGKPSITLSHGQNLLTFDFASLEFTNPAQNQYRYQLVGVDKDWVALGNKNSIQFANLAPGDYTFKVEGSNNDGAWSEQPAELRFTIRPPWWERWWAYVLYLAIVGAVVWLFYRNRLRQKIEHQEAIRLREMDEFKGRFFTNITHEFRTPLTVILGMGDQLLEAETDIQKQGKLGLIKRNGESLLRLINQILDLAKLESRALKINYIQGDVLTYLKYIAESLHSLANAQNLILRVESDQNVIVMDYDPERLLQIVHNLLSNAIKFTPSGGRVVMLVSTHLIGFKNLPSLNIEVTDTGAGIPADELPFLFERFFQAKNQEHAKAGGTGIGLSLAAELVKALGGEISVESTVGKGSTFLVKLPVTKSPLTPKGEPKAGSSEVIFPRISAELNIYGSPLGARGGVRGQSHEGNPSILLIEDNPDVVEYLAACLSSPSLGGGRGEAYALDFAYNGRAGIEKALETVPDLIISDVMMPEKDGFEVLEALKNDERTSHIPIILLTAKADVESRLKGLRRGADAYLSKPFHQEELLVTVENLLELRRKLQARYSDLRRVIGDSDAQSPITIHESPEDVFLQKFRSVVEANLSDTDFEMPQLERALAMSRSQIFRKVKALTGKPPSMFIRSIRLHHGRHLLQTTTLSVSEIAYQVGYLSLNSFSDAFQEEFGERPTAIRG